MAVTVRLVSPAAPETPQLVTPPPPRKLRKGELIFTEGESSRAMFYLKSGMIRIFKKKGDSRIELDTIHSGQVLGELAFLDGNPRSASGEALTDCELIEISGPTFQAVLKNMPEWLKILLKTVVGRLRNASTRIRQLESASHEVAYSEGKRSTNYVFLGALDVLKILTGFLLIAAKHGKPGPEGKGLTMRMGLTTRYINQIMGVPIAKITTMIEVLTEAGVYTTITENLPADSDGEPLVVLNDIEFLDGLITYLNDENLTDLAKRHDVSPRTFFIMNLLGKYLRKFPQDPATGFVSMNIASIKNSETTAAGREPFRMDELQPLIDLGYITNVNMKSKEEAITLVNPKTFMMAYRCQRIVMGIQAANEKKR